MGGMVLETNMNEILLRIQEQDKIEKNEVRIIFHKFYFLRLESLQLHLVQFQLSKI